MAIIKKVIDNPYILCHIQDRRRCKEITAASAALQQLCSNKYGTIIQENGKNCFPFWKRLCNMLQRRTQKPPQIGCGIERSWRRRWGRHTHTHTGFYWRHVYIWEAPYSREWRTKWVSCEWAPLRDVMASFSLTCEDCREGLSEPGCFKWHIGYTRRTRPNE